MFLLFTRKVSGARKGSVIFFLQRQMGFGSASSLETLKSRRLCCSSLSGLGVLLFIKDGSREVDGFVP